MSGMATRTGPSRTYRLIRDTWVVFADGAAWLCRSLWRINRRLARTFLPGQKRAVQSTVAALAVLLEIVGLVVVTADWAARH